MEKKNIFIKVIASLSLIFTVTMNVLANVLPINGVATYEISERYDSLFAPAGYTFAIWGLIYILLAAYGIYQFFYKENKLIGKISVWFTISSIANGLWILAWHYEILLLALLLIIVILASLIMINLILSKERLSGPGFWLIKLPFSIYFGWLTIATIANAAAWLVSLGWNQSQEAWTVAILTVGLTIGVATIIRMKDLAYGLVLLWSYTGILIRHISADGFAWNYGWVVLVASLSILGLVLAEGYLLLRLRKMEINKIK